MPPSIALALFTLGIAGLFYLDRDRQARTSPALWIAAAWIFIGASRMVSQWLGGGPVVDSPDDYLEGSPIDRAVLSVLLAAGLVTLAGRGRICLRLLRANWPTALFFLFSMISVTWSEFPFVALKRWMKALGNLTMVLIVLTDAEPAAAARRVFARTAFFLIPLSVLLIKYYPHLGRGYNRWTWMPYYVGVTTEKNGLGAICLVFGLACLWRFIEAYWGRSGPQRRRTLLAHGIVLAMTAWLFHMANSSTAIACFLLGASLMILVSRSGAGPRTVHLILAVVAGWVGLTYLFPEAYASLVGSLGRDVTLTGRTEIWKAVLEMEFNPLVGSGFESFWLGDRARYFWEKYYFRPNQAHNGYIETYLSLGWIGVALLLFQIAHGYGSAVNGLRRQVPAAALKVAFWVAAVFYNVTEAAFKVMHPVWIGFLFAIIAVPDTAAEEASRQREGGAWVEAERVKLMRV